MRVVAIPAGHVYPQALRPAAGWPDIEVLRDPVIDPAEPGRWWPHPALDPAWWERQPHRIDICHLHFGFEHLSLAQTRDFVAALQQQDVALVLTVHDLDNPHLAQQEPFHRQLGVLVAAATTVLTLSDCASQIIRQRYGRAAKVVPHPPVVPADHPRVVPGSGAAVFLKSLRANVVGEPNFYRELSSRVPLSIYLHRDRADGELARELRGLDLRLHDPMDDQTLFATVAAHEMVVLPYLRGTHSGWLEMCLDLGVKVALPDCGCYLSQAAHPAAVAQYRSCDGTDAARAVAELRQRGDPPPRQHHIDNVQFHEQLYQSLRKGSRA